MRRPASAVVRHIAVLAVGACVYFAQGPSYTRHPTTHLADARDSVLNEWILAWDAHAMTQPDARIWDAPIFYPARGALAFSEAMLGNLWISAPVQWLTGNAVLAANALVFASFLLGMYATFLLVVRLTGDWQAGLVAGLIFSFNPCRWLEVGHLQLLPFFWAPPALLLCQRFLETRRGRYLAGVGALVVAQFYSSMYLGMILGVTLGVFVGAWLSVRPRGRPCLRAPIDRRLMLWVAGTALVAGLALAPLAARYGRVTRVWNFSRTESDNVSFSCEPLGLLVPNAAFASYGRLSALAAGRVQGACSLGVLPWALALVGLFYVRRNAGLPPERVRVAKVLAWTALACASLMLGPYLILFRRKLEIPLPYLAVYHLLPGAKGMRVPTRFVFPLLLCLAALAGFAVTEARVRLRGRSLAIRLVVPAALALALAADYAVADSPGVAPPARDALSPVYDYLARTNPGRPVLELPAQVRCQFLYLHAQTAHWRPLVGGESGSYTPAILEMARRTAGPPTAAATRFLALTPAQTVVVHLNLLEPALADAWLNADFSAHGFDRAGRFGDALVWERRGDPPAAATRLRVAAAELRPVARRFRERVEVRAVLAIPPGDIGWRHLKRGLDDVQLSWTDADGRDHGYRARAELPAYLLPGESAPVALGVLPAEARRARHLRVSGGCFETRGFDVSDGAIAEQSNP